MARIYVDYTFIFDPKEAWEHVSVFNDDLGAFFKQKGFEGEIVEPAGEKQDKIMVYLKKIEILEPLTSNALPPTDKKMSEILKPMRQKRNFEGKFVKENVKI